MNVASNLVTHVLTQQREEEHVVTEAETGMMLLQAKNVKDFQQPPETRKRHGGILPWKLQGAYGPAYHLDFRPLTSRNVRE